MNKENDVNDDRYELAQQHGMTHEYVDWFFDHKKEGCGNVWFIMFSAMWEGWKQQAEKVAEVTKQRDAATLERDYLNDQIEYWRDKCRKVVAEMSIVKNDYATIPEVKNIGWPNTPNFDAEITSLRAEGVEMFAREQNKIADLELAKGDTRQSLLYSGMSLAADYFARQLRENKGDLHE